jgi:hypothetical protein
MTCCAHASAPVWSAASSWHLVCRVCGRVTDVDCVAGEASRVFEYWRNIDPDLGKKIEEGVRANLNSNGA